MNKIEEGLNDLFLQKAHGLQNVDFEQQVMKLEVEHTKILFEEEERWRHKSRAIWITSGEKNTKFFH